MIAPPIPPSAYLAPDLGGAEVFVGRLSGGAVGRSWLLRLAAGLEVPKGVRHNAVLLDPGVRDLGAWSAVTWRKGRRGSSKQKDLPWRGKTRGNHHNKIHPRSKQKNISKNNDVNFFLGLLG